MFSKNSSIRSTLSNTGLSSSSTRPVSYILTHFLDASASQLSHRIPSPPAHCLRSRMSFTLLIFFSLEHDMFRCLVLPLTHGTCGIIHVTHLILPPPPNTLFPSDLYCIVLYLQPVLNPKSYDGARVLEASGRPLLVKERS